VAISPYWVLTVSHAGGTYFIQDGVPYQILQSVTHVGTGNVNADLRLYRVAGPLKYAVPMSFRPFSGQNGLQGETCTLAGFGRTGSRTATGWSIVNGSEGTRRTANNVIDLLIPDVQVSVGGQTKHSDSIFFDLDDPLGQNAMNVSGGSAVPNEGGVATYDSGSGMFVSEKGLKRLVAINAYVATLDGSGVTNWYDFGGIGGGVHLYPYSSWIQATVPDLGRTILESTRLEFGSTILGGSLASLEASDDVRLDLRSPNLSMYDIASPIGIAFTGHTTYAPATSVDITIEGKVPTGAAVMQVALRHWNTRAYEGVRTFLFRSTDSTEHIVGIPAGDFVDPAGKIDCRVRMLGTNSDAVYVRASIDYLRIDAK
jgi:hypothetical protein